jgi:hypothetical protein
MHRLKRAATVLLIYAIAFAAPAPPLRADGTAQTGQTNAQATIQGNALSSTNLPLRDALIRLRDARRGGIVQTTRSDAAGLLVFRSVDPGTYIIELVGSDQSVLAASELLNANAGETITAIVKLPFKLQPYAGVLGHTTISAILVTATAAATGVLAAQVAGEPVSPRR